MAVIYKCKMCGGDLTLESGSTLCTCEYCGTVQTVPVADNEKKITLYLRGSKLMHACEFDKAAAIFEKIISDFPKEAEARWDALLCKYGIEYVDDADGHKVPTCHRLSSTSFLSEPDYKQVLALSDAASKVQYEKEAEELEKLRANVLKTSSQEKPYDIFICYKETDKNGERTQDSVVAQNVYDKLTEAGYRVFFSRITLENMLGAEYEPHIFAALNSAKVMLAFGSSPDYYDSVWVKNEWSRFLKLKYEGQDKVLIPCYFNMDADDLPEEFAYLQAQNLSKSGAEQDLVRGIEKILSHEDGVISAESAENVTREEKKSIKNIIIAAIAIVAILASAFVIATSGMTRKTLAEEPTISITSISNEADWNLSGETINVRFDPTGNQSYMISRADATAQFASDSRSSCVIDVDRVSECGTDLMDYIPQSERYQIYEITNGEASIAASRTFTAAELEKSNLMVTVWAWNKKYSKLFIVGYYVGKMQKDGDTFYAPLTACDYLVIDRGF